MDVIPDSPELVHSYETLDQAVEAYLEAVRELVRQPEDRDLAERANAVRDKADIQFGLDEGDSLLDQQVHVLLLDISIPIEKVRAWISALRFMDAIRAEADTNAA